MTRLPLQRPGDSGRKPEHGDWRVPVSNPAEAEHLPLVPVSMLQWVKKHATDLQAATFDEPVDRLRGWPRVRRDALGALIAALVLVMAAALFRQLRYDAPAVEQESFWLSTPVWFSVLGALAFLTLKLSKTLETALILVYVLGHESTHALAALACRGRVRGFRVNVDGGYVLTDKDNLFISLSPYFVPLWMLVWMLALGLINLAFPFSGYEIWFYGGFGFWWAFHLFWTIWIIPREQPDLKENGYFFSGTLVLFMNMLVLLVILCCFDVMTPAGYAGHFMYCAEVVAELVVGVLKPIGQWFVTMP